MANRTYMERLAATGLESLELRRLRYDLICAYKILSNKFLPPHTTAPEFPGLISSPLASLPIQEAILINYIRQDAQKVLARTFLQIE